MCFRPKTAVVLAGFLLALPLGFPSRVGGGGVSGSPLAQGVPPRRRWFKSPDLNLVSARLRRA
ncbi:MAG: hypothetical protein IPN76_07240 [Saprospiraceae bacterium]|nr:hypothetical protein [Saprospiraceae bacterium]